jgi:uncharacterized protein (TIGR01777 family)
MARVAEHLVRRSEVPAPVEELFAWHERPGALERLNPPWEGVRVEQPSHGLATGTRVVLRTPLLGPIGVRWVAEHVGYDPPREFRDVQRSGPFAAWDHRHRFSPAGDRRSVLSDEVAYRLPLGALGRAVAGRPVRARLERMFAYRHRQTIDDLAAHRRAQERGSATMHVAVTGSSGLIGSALAAFLSTGGHRVTRLVRRAPDGPDQVRWDPDAGTVDAAGLRGVDAVVHLAGESIGGGRWTAEHKRRIRDSRVEGTRLLAEALAGLDGGPRTFVCGSAVGYYGADRGDEVLTEESGGGRGFLADVVRAWEAAADPARAAGLRVVHVRTGIVQSPSGGTLKLQLPLFRAGIGGRLGSGRQWVSWVTLDDIVGVFHHALVSPDLEGVLNGTAPQPVTNAEYTRVLAGVLGRPAVVPVPRFGPAVLLGREGAQETAFASQRVLPARTQATGYVFRHPDLETGLRHVLGRAAAAA